MVQARLPAVPRAGGGRADQPAPPQRAAADRRRARTAGAGASGSGSSSASPRLVRGGGCRRPRIRRWRPPALAAIVAMLTAGLFEYNFGDSEFLMLFLVADHAAVRRRSRPATCRGRRVTASPPLDRRAASAARSRFAGAARARRRRRDARPLHRRPRDAHLAGGAGAGRRVRARALAARRRRQRRAQPRGARRARSRSSASSATTPRPRACARLLDGAGIAAAGLVVDPTRPTDARKCAS